MAIYRTALARSFRKVANAASTSQLLAPDHISRLVSSFSHRDMDPGRSSAKGVELLRQYLEYAASGGEIASLNVRDVPLNPFELSVNDGLHRRGILATPQYGASGYRIDFACGHPREPGRMVLAIEADGASYHSAHTARDRDRLRQQVLESKGWRFHRIWSTAWFRDREAELDKAENAWKQAIAASDSREPPAAAVSLDSRPNVTCPLLRNVVRAHAFRGREGVVIEHHGLSPFATRKPRPMDPIRHAPPNG